MLSVVSTIRFGVRQNLQKLTMVTVKTNIWAVQNVTSQLSISVDFGNFW